MRLRIISATVAVLSLLLNACYYDVEENLYPDDFVPCDSSASTYSLHIAPILQQHCMACHSTSAASGGIVVEGHPAAQALALDGRLLGSVSHASGYSPMPKNVPQLPACDIALIRIWTENGAPNN